MGKGRSESYPTGGEQIGVSGGGTPPSNLNGHDGTTYASKMVNSSKNVDNTGWWLDWWKSCEKLLLMGYKDMVYNSSSDEVVEGLADNIQVEHMVGVL
ncbi:hypothetical protein V6N12_024320 [Hibiscus sabdariffa]|uniref:Uncharacterized protein n=1 Tax=Hibiscus sabdariffa TaxID=183260 RepID=A0ABR2G070_9ROSI